MISEMEDILVLLWRLGDLDGGLPLPSIFFGPSWPGLLGQEALPLGEADANEKGLFFCLTPLFVCFTKTPGPPRPR